MKNGLACIGAAINNHTETTLRDALFSGEFHGNLKNMTGHFLILKPGIQERGDVLARDNQNVDRGLGPDISESHDGIVLINHVPLNRSFDNAAKKTLVHRVSF
jgi:hypothetical protein